MNYKKIEKVLVKLHKLINKANLTIPEQILLYGNLGYHMGASMAGFHNEGPDEETLKREYYSNPTVDVALMISGLTSTSWVDNLKEKPQLSNLADRYFNQQNQGDKTK